MGGKEEEEQALRTQRLVPRRGRKHQGGEGGPSLLPDGEPGVRFTSRGLKSRDRMPYRRRGASLSARLLFLWERMTSGQ